MALLEKLQNDPQGAGSVKLLIIDDEPSIVETVENKFARKGSLLLPRFGRGGDALVPSCQARLIILDIMLPNGQAWTSASYPQRQLDPDHLISARGR